MIDAEQKEQQFFTEYDVTFNCFVIFVLQSIVPFAVMPHPYNQQQQQQRQQIVYNTVMTSTTSNEARDAW